MRDSFRHYREMGAEQGLGFVIEAIMKADIHPKYTEIKVNCSCGNEFTTRSTLGEDLHVEVCSACHPFFTGKQKMMDTAGRVDKFRKRYSRG
jgi:large subunit ribosomal protein L31